MPVKRTLILHSPSLAVPLEARPVLSLQGVIRRPVPPRLEVAGIRCRRS
jgi:hypothetical protein